MIDDLKKVDSVIETQEVFGMFDILAKIESSEEKLLNKTVFMKIQKIEHVKSIQTLILAEKERRLS